MKSLKKQRAIASFELTILVISIFAFSYTLEESSRPIEEAAKESIPIQNNGPTIFDAVAIWIVNKIRFPIIPRVSAQVPEVGCCSLLKDNSICAPSTRKECKGTFAENTLCEHTLFCKVGCCYNENNGKYIPKSRKSECPTPNKWKEGTSCASIPGAQIGCCVLNEKTTFVTERQCEIATKVSLGEKAAITWKKEYSPLQCKLAALGDKMGACEIGGGDCVFSTARQCVDNKGIFNEGYLCTSKTLNTSCEMTTNTICRGEKVYFVDSCMNPANIYDSSRAKDRSYWEKIIPSENSCGKNDANGNAESKDCGNCNKLSGGMCKNAGLDNFKATYGNNYCAKSYCQFMGENYRDGESWCVYDGAIGNGDDVVGSRHWKYVCSQGNVQIEPCTDARQQICTQKNHPVSGKNYELREAHCEANNWRACLNLNKAEDEEEQKENIIKCAETMHCRVEKIDIGDKFKFDICTPKYPAGLDFKEAQAQRNLANICSIATQKCKVVREQKFFGGCKYIANENCLSEEFGQQMNDLCRKVGDCGGEVNIAGKYTKNHKITNSPQLSDSWIVGLIALASPIKSQYAETENYTAIDESLGWFEKSPDPFGPGAVKTIGDVSVWIGGVGAVLQLAGQINPVAAAVSGPLIGTAAGAYIGLALAEEYDLSPVGAAVAAFGGAVAGALTGAVITTGLEFGTIFLGIPIIGWIIISILIVVVAILTLGGSNCDPIEVEFTCKPWKAPKGGDDCSICDGDPLKPCSKYRCESLGASCKFLNDFKKNGICIHEDINDRTPPKISPYQESLSKGMAYDKVTDTGFKIIPIGGGCIDPKPLLFGVQTDEATLCKISPNLTASFDDMQDFGQDIYSLNHSIRLPIPDPSHGKSIGLNWTGELNLKVACQDTHGNENFGPFVINTCVKQGEDKFPTTFEGTKPKNGALLKFNKEIQNMTLITYELATCKWDLKDTNYDSMKNNMFCNDTLFKPSTPTGYSCKTELPLNTSSNKYYFRCKDQPWLETIGKEEKRNENPKSFEYILKKPNNKIQIESISPNSDFKIKTAKASFDLEVQTSGGGFFHICKYSIRSYEKSVEMEMTLASKNHRQRGVFAYPGNYNLYIECFDETGDRARNMTSFEVIQDLSNPLISRVSQMGGNINFETTETATCRYSTNSCNFAWGEADITGTGTTHSINSKRGQTYYIRCEDGFGNKASGCSISVEAV